MTLLLRLCLFQLLLGSTTAVQDGLIRRIQKNYPDFRPQTIIDIGANKGVWSTRVREIYPEANLLLLEATPLHEETLKGVTNSIGKAEHQIAVLTAHEDEVVYFYQGGDTGNSLFQEDTKYYADDKPVERKSTTVDAAIARSTLLQGASEPVVVDIIKADVQGAELVVLQGATKALAQATFVQFEGSTIQYNTGGACFYEVDDFLRSHGFYLYDFADFAYNQNLFKTKGVGQFDVLYIKPTSPRLPPSFVSAGATFCGQDGSQDATSTTSSLDETMGSALFLVEDNLLRGSTMIEQGGNNRRQAAYWIIGFLSGIFTTLAVIGLIFCSRSTILHFKRSSKVE